MKKILNLAAVIIILGTLMLTMTGCSDSSFIKALQNASDKAESITATFDGIEIVSDTADLTLVPSDECKIEYTTHKRITYSTRVEDGVLKIKLEDNRRWFQKVFSFGDGSKLTVYLPAGEYSSLTIKQSTGNIDIPADYKFGSADIDLSTGDTKFCASVVGDLKIHATTGDITLENVSCGSLDTKVSTGKTSYANVVVTGDAQLNATTGDMFLNNVSFGNLSSVASTGDLTATGLNGVGSLSIERSTAKVSLRDVNCGDMTVTVSTGKSSLTNVSCASFTTTGDTGDIDMTGLIASDKIDITRDNGDVHFSGCDAAEINVTTNTGSVTGTLLTNKIFQVRTRTGKIDVPESWEGGKCKITTTTGSVKISIGQ